jgi:HD superfamily phosphodiesterase
MSSMDLFGRISSFVEAHLSEMGKEQAASPIGPKYVFEHSLRVAFWCWRLALEMHADVSTCVTAGLLHAVSHFEPEPKSAETARKFMEKEGFKKEFMDAVAYAIENHAQQGKSKTLESRILEDADKIDRFGYLRLLLFVKTLPESFVQIEESIHSLLAEVEKQEKGEHDETWTSMAKARMNTQINVYKNFLRGILEEIENTRTTMG